jgi:parallel beta-helix repeat protein
MCRNFSLFVAGLGLAVLGSSARAATYEVSTAGNDSNAGTAAAPWRTLQKAANVVNPGNTVLVNNGTYAGFRLRRSGTSAARITIKSKNKWGAKITSTGPLGDVDNVLLLSASYVTIDGFEVSNAARAGICARSLGDDTGADTTDDIVQNCYSHDNGLPSGGAHDGIFTGFARNFTAQYNTVANNGEHGIYISNSADNPIVRGNTSYGNRNCGIQLNADLSTGGGTQDGLISNWLVENNVIYNNGTGGGAGINLDGDINGIARNNLLYNNLATGIALYGIDGAQASNHNLIVNNTIYDPNSTRAALLIADNANSNIAFNNILYSKYGIEIDAATGFQHNYNLVSSITGGSLSANESSPAASTIFANPAGADFHLAATSPALNKGVATFGGKSAPAVDIEGTSRPQGTAFDIGSYETKVTVAGRTLGGTVYQWAWVNSAVQTVGISNTTVNIIEGGVVTSTGTTNSSGAFSLGGSPTTPCILRAVVGGTTFDPKKISVAAGSTDVTGLNFYTYGLRVRVTNSSNQGVANVTVNLTGSAKKSARTDTSGYAYFYGLGFGTYTVAPTAASTAFTPSSLTVNLPTTGLPTSPNAAMAFVGSASGA